MKLLLLKIDRLFFLIVFLVVNNVNFAHAQSYNMDWANSVGTIYNEGITSICIDNNGNTYSVGLFFDSTDFDPGPQNMWLSGRNANGTNSTFIYKTDAAGKPIWVKKFAGQSSTQMSISGASIGIDKANNLYIVGEFYDTVDFDPGPGVHNMVTNTGYGAMYTVKLDSAGNFIWAKVINEAVPISIVGNSLKCDPAGNVYITGTTFGFFGASDSMDFDPGPGVSIVYSNNAFILKLDSSGNLLWARGIVFDVYAGNQCFAQAIDVDISGNVVCTGSFLGTINFDPEHVQDSSIVTSKGLEDIYVVKFDKDGNFKWIRTMGGKVFDEAKGIATDANGNVYTTGNFAYNGFGNLSDPSFSADFDPGPATYNLSNNGGADMFISKLDASGNFVWAKQFGGIGFDRGLSITVSPMGKVYTSGNFTIVDSFALGVVDFDPGHGVFNVASKLGASHQGISVLDISGNFVWGGLVGPPGDGVYSTNSSLVYDSKGNLYLGGDYKAFYTPERILDFDPGPGSLPVNYIKSSDIFMLKLSPCILSEATIINACDSYAFRGEIYKESGVYMDSSASISGICDSIFTLNLTLGRSTFDTLRVAQCDSFEYNGQVYDASGVYNQSYPTETGCYSTIVISLEITGRTPDTAVVVSGHTLTALASGIRYQWINCDVNSPILGANEQSFTPEEGGSYAVVVMNNGECIDTSKCYVIAGSNVIDEEKIGDEVKLYPNPARELVTLKLTRPLTNATIRLINLLGQTLLQEEDIKGTVLNLDLKNYLASIYTLEIRDGQRHMSIKFVKSDNN